MSPPQAEMRGRRHIFAGPVGTFVNLVEPHSEASPLALAVQLVAAFGNAVGRGAYLAIEATRHYPVINVVIVGNSATSRKGTSWGHVQRLLKLADPAWLDASLNTSLSTGEGLVNAARAARPDEPERAFAGVVLVVASEFGGLLTAAARRDNTLSMTLRDAFDGGRLQVVTRTAPLCAPEPHITIVGHITMPELHCRLQSVDVFNGFLNRFLFVCVDRSKRLPFAEQPDEAAMQALGSELGEAIDEARRRGELKLSPEARRLWDEGGAYERLTADDGLPPVAAVTSRRAPQALRIACIYALLSQAPMIEEGHLRAGIEMTDVGRTSACAIFGQIGVSRKDQEVLASIRKRPRSRTELREEHFHGRPSVVLDGALERLQHAGLVLPQIQRTAGRPKEVWVAAESAESSQSTAAPQSLSALSALSAQHDVEAVA